ncbi:hypothetical protein PCC9214_01418 [Planktothrix tepida]|uniref:Uncharacterized protein n=2 Tax=Planktothrix TaxID=54304 RepID=A0A1J1LGV8_9CYAN|nr:MULTISPECIES: hypothetical protein [Planktothrix]MBD2482842.1 hypothetical protein [Planktothrix sp. FACHB-1365]CAD5933104.1 hypothetical protein PCC9214_01418 [Planktothrix tepida]CAD5977838.1 hypothetical protein NO713_04334 [Planktothrix pseudagardhii]CUR31712.1 conserved hypothetical protein [Planktothrix tepida PCC 9214]
MRPKIKDPMAWQQAELLMQPAFIRLLDNIRKQLDESIWTGTYQEIQDPFPGYRLDLEHNGQKVSIDIWELCYQICFQNYRPTHAAQESLEVEIDTTLIDQETGDVDWQKLEDKTRQIIEDLFARLTP